MSEKGEQLGVLDRLEAIKMAEDKGLDLVEVAPQEMPPTCKIMDYNKFVYDKMKLRRMSKKKQHIVVVKEVRMGPNIEEHDFQNKLRNIIRFLQHGDKVKVSILFKGRQIAFKDKGKGLLVRIKDEVLEYGEVEKQPLEEGRQMFMVLSSKGVNKKGKSG